MASVFYITMDETAKKTRISPLEARKRLSFDDAALLAECEVHTHRTGGPGGQHRNKTETAVRLVHRPTGLIGSAGETRSQHENRARALRRLREAIALEIRLPPPGMPEWPDNVRVNAGRLRVSEDNPALPEAIALVLDYLAAHEGQISAAAEQMGLTSSSTTKFLAAHPHAWVAANEIRARFGLRSLNLGS